MGKNFIYYFLALTSFILTQEIFTEYLIVEQDTLDTFSYQIPENYNNEEAHPLLLAFHQWGGDESSNYYTQFDEESNLRGWIMLSPYGGSPNNYNHQGAQSLVEQEIIWMQNNFNINPNKIYMVGGSMGGASGAIYANNHLDPTKPMVAATASASGILDCERRAIEMDGNNSMIEWFGGNWDEVPFEYHRNSAVYFTDPTQSMHYNLQYTPLYLDFGATEPHRTHAEELYDLLSGYNDLMWIDTDPEGSHGYSVFEELHVCNWLEQFDLISNPASINVNLDEPSRAYWIEAYNIDTDNNFIKIEATYTSMFSQIKINQYSNSDSLILHTLDEQYLSDNNNITFLIDGDGNTLSNINIGFTGPMFNGSNISNIHANLDFAYDDYCSSFNYYIDENNIIWVERFDLFEDTICYTDIPYNISFDFLLPNEYDDVNQDGIWNVIDVIMIMNHILNINLLTNTQLINADLNDDSIVDILDVVNLVNIILSE